MRTDHKISEDCILVSYDSPARGLHARKPGKENLYNLEPIVEINEKAKKILVHKTSAEKFGLVVDIDN